MTNRIFLALRRSMRRCRRTAPPCAGRVHYPMRSTALVTMVLAAGMALFVIGLLEFRLRPVVEQLAARQVNNHVTAKVNAALSTLVNTEGPLVDIQRGPDGEILAITGNMNGLNQVRARAVQMALDTIAQVEVHTLGVPLGSLFDFDLLWAKGPVVRIHCLVAGTVSANVRSEFQSAGINQTLHRIVLDLEIPLHVLLPGSRGSTVARLSLCVAETVVVGKVPQTYLNLT